MSDHPIPDEARAKLAGIEGARADAGDAQASATRRLNGGGAGSELEAARLSAVREREFQKHEALSGLMWRMREWLNGLAPGVVLEMAPPIAPELEEGESLQQAVARTREAISAATLQLITARNAPLPKEHLKAAARTHVAERAACGRPAQIAVERGRFCARWPECDFAAPAEWVLDTFAWLNPDQLIAAFEAEIDARGESKDALGALEKAKLVSELETRIDLLERQEEALITTAAEQGIEILRRGNASPMAVLGLVVATEAKAQAAA